MFCLLTSVICKGQRCLQLSKNVLNCRCFSKSAFNSYFFYERNNRGFEYPVYPGDRPVREHIRDGKKIFVQECKVFVEEVKEYCRNDPKLYSHGDTEVFFRFDSEEKLKKWRLGSDKHHNEGMSECSLVMNDKGKAIFSGNLDTTPPKDGKVRFAGYCGMKSARKTKSFLRDDNFYWKPFTHLEIHLRGDGRTYAINLGMGMYYDVNFFDIFSYQIYTHGGPYWQLVRIPFSKFILTAKGRVQDKQGRVPLSKVNSVGITAAYVPGPFRLEIDYIGCHIDHSYKEEFAYEMYKVPKEFVSS